MKIKKTLMSEKFRSMLFGGTVTRIAAIILFIADSIIGGRLFGEDALSGINLVSPLFSAALFMSMIFSTGIPVLYGKALGKFDKDEADRFFGFGLLISILSGVIIFSLSFFLGDLYLGFFHASETVVFYAGKYLFWMSFVFLVMPLQTFIGEMVYEDGDELLSTGSDVFQALVNIPLSVVLCMKLGTAGLSLGTFITTFMGLLFLLLHFLKKTNTLKPNLYFSLKVLVDAARYSLIDASSYLFLAFYAIVLEKYTVLRFGPEMLAVVSMIITINELSIIFDGIGDAMSPILSVYIGEEAFQGMSDIFRLARRTSNIEGITVSALMLILAPVVPGILGIDDPELVLLCTDAARIISLGFVFTSLLFLLSSYYLLFERIALSLMICALRDLILPVVMAVLTGEVFGLYGMFSGLAFAPFFAAVITAINIRRRFGRAEYPMLIPNEELKKTSALFNLTVSKEETVHICDEIESTLTLKGYEKKHVLRVRLIAEELFMLIHEINGKKAVLAECLLVMNSDRIDLIERDNGKVFDLTDEDMPVNSLRAYLITQISASYVQKKRFMPVLSENRNTFSINVS
ncbi:MAG: hypothetical protein J6P45_04350 [Lachnospiraceae bacterium]|nr:hypothetical protein [Lachnospiraceae bacterium]